jgi:hypothetical protein
MFSSKFFHVTIDGKKTLIGCSKDGFDEITKKCLHVLRRTDMLKIAKSCNIKISRLLYDFEIAEKIKEWRPSSPQFSYSRRELIKLSKKEMEHTFKVHNLNHLTTSTSTTSNVDKSRSKNDLIELFLECQNLHCDEIKIDDST